MGAFLQQVLLIEKQRDGKTDSCTIWQNF